MDEKEKDLYFQARNLALERHVDKERLRHELIDGYMTGIDAAFQWSMPTDEVKKLLDRVKPETNFGFGFLTGVISVIEGLKGKAYKANWIKYGEHGAFDNIQRKFGRVESAMVDGQYNGAEFPDSLGDLSVYGLKTLTAQSIMRPDDLYNWFRNVHTLVQQTPL